MLEQDAGSYRDQNQAAEHLGLCAEPGRRLASDADSRRRDNERRQADDQCRDQYVSELAAGEQPDLNQPDREARDQRVDA